jgi:hypothetical protein
MDDRKHAVTKRSMFGSNCCNKRLTSLSAGCALHGADGDWKPAIISVKTDEWTGIVCFPDGIDWQIVPARQVTRREGEFAGSLLKTDRRYVISRR